MNNSRSATLAEALGHLKGADNVFVRLAISHTDAGEKVLRSFLIDVLPQRWLNRAEESLRDPWRKPKDPRLPFGNGNVFFFSDWLRGETVLEWFKRPDHCEIKGFHPRQGWEDRRESFVLPDMHDNVIVETRPSHTKGTLPFIPYPYVLYTMQPKVVLPPQQRDADEIVGLDGEYFRNFGLAQAEVIYEVIDTNAPIQTSNSVFAIRVVDGRGWLREVRVLHDKVDATVVGSEVIGRARVTVSGSGLRATEAVRDSHVLLNLPSRIPDEVEVILMGGGAILDKAYFSSTRNSYPRNSPQVVVEREDVFGYIPSPMQEEEQTMTPQDVSARVVFVVHGRDLTMRNEMFTFLRSIGLQPLEWGQAVAATQTAAPYVGQVLDAAFSKARAVVVLLTPDDEARLREPYWHSNEPDYEKNLTPQARPNVLFEAGMAFGRHPDRTVLVELGTLRPFSDVAGRHVVRMDGSTQQRQELAQRLGNAGCAVDLSGTDWHTAGTFSAVSRSDAPTEEERPIKRSLDARATMPPHAPVLVPDGSPTFNADNPIWLKWDERSQSFTITNHGSSPAFNVAAVLYGCESYIIQGNRDPSSRNEHWTCWLGKSLSANEALKVSFEFANSIFFDDNKSIAGYAFNAPPQPGPREVAEGKGTFHAARMVITYQDASGQKYASIFDYVPHLVGWERVATLPVDNDLNDLLN